MDIGPLEASTHVSVLSDAKHVYKQLDLESVKQSLCSVLQLLVVTQCWLPVQLFSHVPHKDF